jgi:hypothetical protein
MVRRFVSVRIDDVLAEREEISHAITSLRGEVVSWNPRPDLRRTYGLLAVPPECDAAALLRALHAHVRLNDPALVVLEVIPDRLRCLAALQHALGGAGRPVGIVDVVRTDNSLLLELDAACTPLSLVVDTIDVELEQAPGRRVVFLLPPDDAVLAGFARDLLNDPALDASRLIETYVE